MNAIFHNNNINDYDNDGGDDDCDYNNNDNGDNSEAMSDGGGDENDAVMEIIINVLYIKK